MACANLGTANDFNVFVLGNHTQSFVDAEGRVAVGGNATYNSYGIGNTLTVSTTRADLIVGGNMNIIGGTNFSGNSVISPTGTVINYTMTNNNGVRPQPQIGTPINFPLEGQYLTCASASWGALAATGTAAVNFGQINLTGTSTTLNIFSINGANVAGSGVSLSSANGINLIVPTGSTVLVNIAGTGVGFGSYSIFQNGVTAPPSAGAFILWNFYQATSAFNLNLAITGSVLAPNAAWSAAGFGNIDGTMVAQSFTNTTGSLEAHNYPFGGCLPAVSCTPQLTIVKTVNGAASFTGTAGTAITYVIQVTNSGSGTLTNVVINDPLLGFTQSVPQLPAGQQVTYTLQSQVQAGNPGSSYTNTATAQSDQTAQQSASVTITIEGTLTVRLVKTANVMSASPGDTVDYQFSVVNTAQIPLQNVTLTDPTLGLNLSFPTFTSGTIATFPYTIPQNAVIGSTLVNTATLGASNLPQPATAQASVLITETPSLSIMKSASQQTALPGDTIPYTITVMNDSIVTPIYNIQLTDPLLSLNQTIAVLNPQASVIVLGMYTVPAGTPAGTLITNTATIQSALGTQTATAQVAVAPSPSISITKLPSSSTVDPGSSVIYNFVVTNTGNVPLTNVQVTDPTLSFSTTIALLAIGAQNSSEASFTIPLGTPAGTKFFNTATVTSDQAPTEQASNEVIVSSVYSLSIQKIANPVTAAPGDTVNYSIIVTNTSNAPITNVVITDPTLGLMQLVSNLPENGLVMYEVPFVIPPGTVAGTVLTNTVSAVSDQTTVMMASAQITVLAVPVLALTKTVAPTSANPGDTVTYTIVVSNSGNENLTNVIVVDTTLNVNQTIPLLAIGSQFTINAPFMVPADPPGTILINTSTATSDQTPGLVQASAYLTVTSAPAITLTKTASAASVSPGQTITYTLVLTNSSAITLTNITVQDTFLGIVDRFPVLLAGSSRTFSLNYTVPADAPGGSVITNVVTAISDQTPLVTAQAQTTVINVPSLSILKTVNTPTAVPEQTVEYTLQIVNTGNTTLSNILVTDDNPPFNSVIPELVQGASTMFILPYTLPEDSQPGTIILDTATAGSVETGTVSSTAEITVLPFPTSAITVQKLVDQASAAPGATVNFTIILTNNADFTLTDIAVNDPLLGISQTIASIAVGASVTLTSPYVLPLNAPAGSLITNTATATIAGESVSGSASVTVAPSPALTLTKTPDALNPAPGSTINYTLVVTNMGNTILTNVAVTDPTLGFAVTYPTLAIGASETAVVPYAVPLLPPGTIITNTSTATSDQTPLPVSTTARISVDAPATLAITKTASPTQGIPGDVIMMTIVVTNTSVIPLTNVIVTDGYIGWTAVLPLLPVGASKTIEVNYTIPPMTPVGTVIINTATAVSDQTLAVSSQASVIVTGVSSLALSKIEDNRFLTPGQTQFYTIQVTNTGNTPLTGVTVVDSLLGINEAIGTLLPLQTIRIRTMFQVPLGLRAGSKIFNISTATSDQTASQEAMTNLTIGALYAIKVTKNAQAATVPPGSPITFTTVVTNLSNAELTNIVILDPLVNLVETVTSLAAGSTLTLTSIVPTSPTTPVNAVITNTVDVLSNQTAPAVAASSVVLLPGPLLTLSKQFPAFGYPGQRVPITLIAANAGNIPLNQLLLTDPLIQLSVRQAQLMPEMAITVNEFYTIPANATIGSTIVNQASIVSNETAPIQVTKELKVLGLRLVKSASTSTADVHGTVDFLIQVSNPTPYAASNVVLTDPVPSGTAIEGRSITRDGRAVPGASLKTGLSLGTLQPGASTAIGFKLDINTAQPNEQLSNQAFAAFVLLTSPTLSGVSASNLVTVEVMEHEE